MQALFVFSRASMGEQICELCEPATIHAESTPGPTRTPGPRSPIAPTSLRNCEQYDPFRR
jgi:hypothetical protein